MFLRQRLDDIFKSALASIEKKHELGAVHLPSSFVRAIETGEHGDYASTLPFQLAKLWHTSPEGAGMAVKEALEATAPGGIFKLIDPVRGFLNIVVDDGIYQNEVIEILKAGAKYGSGKKKKESYSLDYLDANPTGPVHIGHARSGFLGDIVARVLKRAGYPVSREFYVNNARSSGQIQSLGRTVRGEGEEYMNDELTELLKKPGVAARLKKTKNAADAGSYIASCIQKKNAEFLKKRAGIQFDLFFEEQSVYGKKLHTTVLRELEKKGALYTKEGAVWFRAKKFGDTEDRVLVRSTGEPTYILPDIAYHIDRLVRRKYTYALDVFGADHHGYGPRLRGALTALGIAPDRVHIITAQTVRLMKDGTEFKMSKRKGIFVALEDLIAEVGADAVRFFFILHSPDTHMDFDMSLAVERSAKNPVYYAQYSYARIASIMRHAKRDGYTAAHLALLTTPEERKVMKMLSRFPELIEDTARDFNVLRLGTYAIELARVFHHFYENCRVISDDKKLTEARLALAEAVRIVLKNTFDCIGISAPEKM